MSLGAQTVAATAGAAGTAGGSAAMPLALIMAGGTGGHVFPALALARELHARSWRVVWLGTRLGLESRLVPAEHIEIEWLSVGGLRGKGWLIWLSAPLRLTRALLQALAVIRRRRPSLVVGLGGFVAGPGGLAAWLLRRPLLIHEQNAVAGFTNRCLAHFARLVLTAFPGQLQTRCRRPRDRQSRAVRDLTAAGAAPAVRNARPGSASAGAGRQPGRGTTERHCSLRAGAADHGTEYRSAPPIRRALVRGGAAQLRNRPASRRDCSPSSTIWPKPMAGRTS